MNKTITTIPLKIILLSVFIWCASNILPAQKLYVLQNNGTENGFEFTHKPKITFDGEMLQVVKREAGQAEETFDYQRANVRYLSFKSSQSNIVSIVNDNSVQVFPNPVMDELEVITKTPNMRYRINDISGRMVASGTINSTSARINMQKFRTGVYFLNIDDDTTTKSFKIVKQ